MKKRKQTANNRLDRKHKKTENCLNETQTKRNGIGTETEMIRKTHQQVR